MLNIQQLRKSKFQILVIGNHKTIMQSMLDFDFIAGRMSPGIIGIIAGGRKYERYFWGKDEILISVYSSLEEMPEAQKNKINLFLNVTSARRVLTTTKQIFTSIPNVLGGVVFAENLPEKHALELQNLAIKTDKFIIGPASVGLLLPDKLKLGAIGGTDARQQINAHLFESGDTAVFSSSGGMTNEIINLLAQHGQRISFAFHFGGDRFPVIRPRDAFLIAEEDPPTKQIVYFGELGGRDEYELAELLVQNRIKKKVICYIAGTISDYFPNPPQFGHAKAMAAVEEESAKAKIAALKASGAQVGQSFADFAMMLEKLPKINREGKKYNEQIEDIKNRKSALITSTISEDREGKVFILDHDLLPFTQKHSFAYLVSSLFLGREIKSQKLEQFVDFILRLAIDHGPYVSGAINTIITARAGKDLVSSLAAGLLTIGSRFGGATNQAAQNWLQGVSEKTEANSFVEDFASRKIYIAGIGHRKYTIDFPDPRVIAILDFAQGLQKKRFINFARSVEKITTAKKGNLILNVDGAIAAVLLDVLSEEENLSDQHLRQLVDQEFFNALFILSRSVGFIAHFLDQKRLDEGLFRLEEKQVAHPNINIDEKF